MKVELEAHEMHANAAYASDAAVAPLQSSTSNDSNFRHTLMRHTRVNERFDNNCAYERQTCKTTPPPGVAVAKQRRRPAPAHCQPCSRCRCRRRCRKTEQRGLGARDIEELDGRHPRCRWRRPSPRTGRRWQRRVRRCRSRSPTARRTYGCAHTQTESKVSGQREGPRQFARGLSTCLSKSHLPSRTRRKRAKKKMWNSPNTKEKMPK